MYPFSTEIFSRNFGLHKYRHEQTSYLKFYAKSGASPFLQLNIFEFQRGTCNRNGTTNLEAQETRVFPQDISVMTFHSSTTKASRSRMVLTDHQAREIFQLKTTHGFSSSHAASIFLASKYNVSSKAIRDIWKGRSWLEATFNLWNIDDRPARRILGRPKGKKDSKPRASKQNRKMYASAQSSGEGWSASEGKNVSQSDPEPHKSPLHDSSPAQKDCAMLSDYCNVKCEMDNADLIRDNSVAKCSSSCHTLLPSIRSIKTGGEPFDAGPCNLPSVAFLMSGSSSAFGSLHPLRLQSPTYASPPLDRFDFHLAPPALHRNFPLALLAGRPPPHSF
jgi:hypothetical protein